MIIQKCSVDAVARCLVQGLTQYNGAFGCSHCKEKGTVVAKGRGRCRIFENTKNLDLISDADHRNTLLGPQLNYGVKNATPLLKLLNFNIVDGIVIEPMHNLFLGVSKAIVNL
ncbi:unnamed protein product, partial [Allacma fusca]